LAGRFQVRLYQFGKEPERIPNTDHLTPSAPASRIGDTLERVLAESSSLPLGAIVLLSVRADNSGGIDLATIAAIRRQSIPVHTIGFGKEHPDRDLEKSNAEGPARPPDEPPPPARPPGRAGRNGSKPRLIVKDNGKVLASQDITLNSDGQPQ